VSEDCADTLGNQSSVSFGYNRNIPATGAPIIGDHRTGSGEQLMP
jgi:hypothetical protein